MGITAKSRGGTSINSLNDVADIPTPESGKYFKRKDDDSGYEWVDATGPAGPAGATGQDGADGTDGADGLANIEGANRIEIVSALPASPVSTTIYLVTG